MNFLALPYDEVLGGAFRLISWLQQGWQRDSIPGAREGENPTDQTKSCGTSLCMEENDKSQFNLF